MESPFRCLDEFDVFMDMVNRRIAMDMMMDVAQQHLGHQFIFLTPQDMSHLGVKSNVRIFQMPSPERGSGVLPYQPEEQDEDQDEDGGNTRRR
jgi:chromosome segregation ATPase